MRLSALGSSPWPAPQNVACATKFKPKGEAGIPVDKPKNGPVIPLSAAPNGKSAGQMPQTGQDNTQSDGFRPARGYSWPPFEPGHELSLRHGGYSAKRIGERARVVAQEVLELAPHLSAPEFSLAVSSYAMSRARVELLSAAIETAVAQVGAVKLGARLVEAATGASREEAQQRASLGLDPRSLAELRAISSTADLNVALLHQIAPELPRAIEQALEALGHGDRAQEFTQHFVAALRAAEQEDQ